MIFRKSKVRMAEKPDEKKLETALRHLSRDMAKPSLTVSEKERVKAHLLNSLHRGANSEFLPSGLDRLTRRIRRTTSPVHIPQWALHMLKERVLDFADSSVRLRGFNVFGHASLFRSAASAFLLVIFVLTSVLLLPAQIPFTYAKDVVFDRLNGDVFVLRDDKLLKAETSMKLLEGDAIVTKHSSSATIRFVNDSVSRLGENTQLELRRLTRLPFRPSAMDVEMFVHEGRVWNKVVHGTDDATRFVVDTSRLAAVAEKKAAFDVYETTGSTELAVFDNIVQVTTVQAKVDVPRTLVAGYTAEVVDNEGGAMKIDVLPKHEISRRESSPWVAENLTNDRDYEQTLVYEKEQMIESAGNQVPEGSQPLADPKAEELRQHFLDAYKVFVKSQTAFMRGTRVEALADLKDFQVTVGDILVQTNGMDSSLKGELFTFMRDRVDSQLEDYANFHPGHKLYTAKEALQNLQVKLAPDAAEKARIELFQAESMLLEIEQLSGDNKLGFAEMLLKKYQQRTNDFTSSLQSAVFPDAQTHFEGLVSKQAEQVKLLTAVEQSLVYADQQTFRIRVREVRQDTLRKFVLALDQLPYAPPQKALYEIRDLYDMYGEDGSPEEEMIEPALNKYLAQDYQVSFIDPAGLTPEDLEVLPLSDSLEATGDAQDNPVLTDGEPMDTGISDVPDFTSGLSEDQE